MGNKTSHRRKNHKPRDPMALALADPLYRQRRVEPRFSKEDRDKRKSLFKRLKIDSEECD